MLYEYDGCSDFFFEAGTVLLDIYPAGDKALKDIKDFITEYSLTSDEVKIIKNKESMRLITKADITLTMLHKGNVSNSCAHLVNGCGVKIHIMEDAE